MSYTEYAHAGLNVFCHMYAALCPIGSAVCRCNDGNYRSSGIVSNDHAIGNTGNIVVGARPGDRTACSIGNRQPIGLTNCQIYSTFIQRDIIAENSYRLGNGAALISNAHFLFSGARQIAGYLESARNHFCQAIVIGRHQPKSTGIQRVTHMIC